jgi:hypothetical protein
MTCQLPVRMHRWHARHMRRLRVSPEVIHSLQHRISQAAGTKAVPDTRHAGSMPGYP